jgi:hypothetical protein
MNHQKVDNTLLFPATRQEPSDAKLAEPNENIACRRPQQRAN